MFHLLTMFAVFQPDVVPNRCGARYAPVAAALTNADEQIRRRRFEAANATLDAALNTLGHVPVNSTTVDHTELNLLHAESLARRGRTEAALQSKSRILATRLKRCTQPLVTP